MKAILMSIRPNWVAKILNGEKTIEVRKRFTANYRGWVYIYCTKGKPYLFESDWSHNEGRLCVVPSELNKAIEYVKSTFRYYGKENDYCYSNLYGTPYGNLLELRKYYSGKVVARFYCDNVEEISYNYRSDFTSVYTDTLDTEDLEERACLTRHEFAKYLKGENGYAIHISKLEIFDEPKELNEFYPYCKDEKCEYRKNHCSICYRPPLTKAPQSHRFIEVDE